MRRASDESLLTSYHICYRSFQGGQMKEHGEENIPTDLRSMTSNIFAEQMWGNPACMEAREARRKQSHDSIPSFIL